MSGMREEAERIMGLKRFKRDVGLEKMPKCRYGGHLTISEMNPFSLNLYIGQVFDTVLEEESTKKKHRRKATIKEVYPHHVLCMVSGHRECFTYNELSTMNAIRRNV